VRGNGKENGSLVRPAFFRADRIARSRRYRYFSGRLMPMFSR